jgi:hypothetical protein
LAVVATFALAVALLIGSPAPRLVEATPTRTPTLAEQSHHYSVSQQGIDLSSVVATLNTDCEDDHRLEIQTYVTPSGGSEQKRSKGVAWVTSSGSGFVVVAQPVTLYASGDVVRAVFKIFDDEEGLQYTSQISITIP